MKVKLILFRKNTVYEVNKRWLAFTVLFIIIIPACTFNRQKQSTLKKNELKIINCVLSVNQIKKIILGKRIDQLDDIKGCFFFKDTTIYEDDQIFWKGTSYYKGDTLRFLVESNWKDTIHVKRITFFDSSIKTNDGICVGSELKDIKNYIIKNAAPNPDGYLSFYDKSDSTIYYYMDIRKYPKLLNGEITNADKMLVNLKVSTIIINEKN